MTKRALVTGGAGFVGQWMARAMLALGWEVYSAGVGSPTGAVLTPAERGAVRWLEMDVRSRAQVIAALDAARPDAIVHLAGISYLPSAADAPAEAWAVNVVGAVTLLSEVARRLRAGALDPRILVAGSAQQYGRHDPGELPLSENAEQRPLTVYAASKAAQEIAAMQAFRADGVQAIATRSFNHSGVGHDAHFLLPALVRRALALREGADSERVIQIGNGDAIRDYLHVADVVDAYLALLDRGIPGEAYNVCSGEGVRVRTLTEQVLEHAGVVAEISSDPALQRSVDVPALVGSPEKLARATGWRPRRTRDDIIDDLLHAATH
ncbi:MAG: SDR family NAD(P)-dependent oxidoreductase [Gemmatimonadota bacterium]|nr:SDR family NAD(P)-dependent oxidoreductase [Gemmatimonadota bacterium]